MSQRGWGALYIRRRLIVTCDINGKKIKKGNKHLNNFFSNWLADAFISWTWSKTLIILGCRLLFYNQIK